MLAKYNQDWTRTTNSVLDVLLAVPDVRIVEVLVQIP